jgi:hypothetical protein
MAPSMNAPAQAVFLSYASQDSEPARVLCEAIRATGVEAWFDQSELRGGDAWDQAIRRQIKECGLFIPLISANSNARNEGYFRLEWRLAVDRSLLMADDAPFIFPIVIDASTEPEARVPDRFREVQWSRLGKDTPAAIAERVRKLLAGGAVVVPRADTRQKPRSRKRYFWIGVGIVFGAYTFLKPLIAPKRVKNPPAATAPAEQPKQEAKEPVVPTPPSVPPAKAKPQ